MNFESLMDKLGGRAPGSTKAVRELNKIHMTPAAKARASSLKGAGSAGNLGRSAFIADLIVGIPAVQRGVDYAAQGLTTNTMRAADALFDLKDAQGRSLYIDDFGKPQLLKTSDPKKESGGGLNTGTGKVEPKPQKEVTTYDSFQEQQAALMGSLGITANPFSSTRLATTSDSIYNNFPTGDDVPDFGIDTSKMLTNVDTAKLSELYNNPDRETTFRISDDPFLQDYVPPVNYNAGQGSVDPKFYPEQQSSMKAMRMKDRDLGLMYASGQFFAENKDGKSVLVNRDLAKDVRRGKEGAADQLAAYLAGGGIKPEGGVIANPKMNQMVPAKQEEATSLVDPSFSRGDYEFMGGNPANSAVMQEGGAMEETIDRNTDIDNPQLTQIGALQSPFSKVLAENPLNGISKLQVVDENKYGSVRSLQNKYGEDKYFEMLDAGMFF